MENVCKSDSSQVQVETSDAVEALNGPVDAPADPRTSRAPHATPEAATRAHSTPHGIKTADTLPAWLYQRFVNTPDAPAWDALTDGDRAYWAHEAAAVRRAVKRGGFKTTAEETHVVADDSNDPEHVDDCPGCATAPDFFQPGRTYLHTPLRWRFRCDAVTTHPDTGARVAVGWSLFAGHDKSQTGDMSEEIWAEGGWTDVTEAGEVPA